MHYLTRCLDKQVFRCNQSCFLLVLSIFSKVFSTTNMATRPTVSWGKQSDANLMFEVFI